MVAMGGCLGSERLARALRGLKPNGRGQGAVKDIMCAKFRQYENSGNMDKNIMCRTLSGTDLCTAPGAPSTRAHHHPWRRSPPSVARSAIAPAHDTCTSSLQFFSVRAAEGALPIKGVIEAKVHWP